MAPMIEIARELAYADRSDDIGRRERKADDQNLHSERIKFTVRFCVGCALKFMRASRGEIATQLYFAPRARIRV